MESCSENVKLKLLNWLNKQVPGSNLQIENQNLTVLDGIIDSSNKTNPTSKCNADKKHFPMASVCAMVAHTLELLLQCTKNVEFNLKIIIVMN